MFSDLVTLTLAIELIPNTSIVQIYPYTKFGVDTSNGLAMRVFRERWRDRRTVSILYPRPLTGGLNGRVLEINVGGSGGGGGVRE